MSVFSSEEFRFGELVAELSYCNPFLPERIELERQALGSEFDTHLADWNVRAGAEIDHPNLIRIVQRAKRQLSDLYRRIASSDQNRLDLSAHEADLYEHLTLFVLYHEYRPALDELVQNRTSSKPATIYRKLVEDADRWLTRSSTFGTLRSQLPHIFAGFYQLRRAFGNIFRYIVGSSRATVRLRAAVWESIFTHDMRRYRRLLYDRMADFATLITGPSGTGKELVARAIGLSRYVPFDGSSGAFAEQADGSFFPINLSAMSPTLIESELFGHVRGAFTGAVADRMGWLETCPRSGTVFLDEVGELDPEIQVKLLRVLQSREFSRLGESASRHFPGKIVAATNRSLADAMNDGHFREDLYYRLCSDVVEVPSLRQRFDDDPGELRELILHLAQRMVGPEGEQVVDEVEAVIMAELGTEYAWPGNVRELEQCIRNVLVRRTYRPPQRADARELDFGDQLCADLRSVNLTAEELVRRYCQFVYRQTGSFEATARKLGLDRRTVKAKVQAERAP